MDEDFLLVDIADAGHDLAHFLALGAAELLIFGQKPNVFWTKIAEEAEAQQKVSNLIAFGRKRFPKIDFPALERQVEDGLSGTPAKLAPP